MLYLACSSKLATLRRLLVSSFPESLKVCGAVHHVIHDNPFRLQVLVDQWPEFTSVICRPALEEMTDPLDPYTNTYFLFSKDPQSLRQMLQDPQAVNWKQLFQIQGCQPQLGKVLQEVSSTNRSEMHTISNLLYVRDKTEKVEMKTSTISDLQFSTLRPDEARLVNAFWVFGGNERSERFVERCINTFPNVCARKGGVGPPVAWVLSDHSSELRMAYTDSLYRNRGMFRTMLQRLSAMVHPTGAPIYGHVTPDNKSSQAANVAAGLSQIGRWQQWKFQPL